MVSSKLMLLLLVVAVAATTVHGAATGVRDPTDQADATAESVAAADDDVTAGVAPVAESDVTADNAEGDATADGATADDGAAAAADRDAAANGDAAAAAEDDAAVEDNAAAEDAAAEGDVAAADRDAAANGDVAAAENVAAAEDATAAEDDAVTEDAAAAEDAAAEGDAADGDAAAAMDAAAAEDTAAAEDAAAEGDAADGDAAAAMDAAAAEDTAAAEDAAAEDAAAEGDAAAAEDAAAAAEDADDAMDAAAAEDTASVMDAAAAESAATNRAAAASELDTPPCSNCPVVTLQHYTAKGCTPNYDDAVSDCCVSSFTCLSEEERNLDLGSCYRGGVGIKAGNDFPLDDPCQPGCLCSHRAGDTEPATVHCAVTECGHMFSGVKPNCVLKYISGQCCPDQVCTSDDASTTNTTAISDDASTTSTTAPFICSAEGKEYSVGRELNLRLTPCQSCLCTENYTDPYGPGCETIECGMEYRRRSELRNGCTPKYFITQCCSIDWVCPESTLVKGAADQVATGAESPTTHCTLGNIVAPRGTFLETTQPELNCGCSTPPDFTCIEYIDAEQATVARESGMLP